MSSNNSSTPAYQSFLLRIRRPAADSAPHFQLQAVSDKSVRNFTNPHDLIAFLLHAGTAVAGDGDASAVNLDAD